MDFLNYFTILLFVHTTYFHNKLSCITIYIYCYHPACDFPKSSKVRLTRLLLE